MALIRMCGGGVWAWGWRAGGSPAGDGRGAADRAHAAAGAGADDPEDRVFADEVRAVVDRADEDGAGGFGLGEGESVGLQPLGVDVGGGGVEPGPAAAKEDGQEGEEEGAQDGVQAQLSRRVSRAGLGRALRPAVGECLHLVSLHRWR